MILNYLFKRRKGQLAYYCNRKGLKEGIYIVFIENKIKIKDIKESKEIIDSVEIKTYLIRYDEKTDLGKGIEEDDYTNFSPRFKSWAENQYHNFTIRRIIV